MGVEERSLARDALVSTLLLAEPPAVKLLADAFRIVVRQDFVPKPESWPQLLPLLHSGVQTRYFGLSHSSHVGKRLTWATFPSAVLLLHVLCWAPCLTRTPRY